MNAFPVLNSAKLASSVTNLMLAYSKKVCKVFIRKTVFLSKPTANMVLDIGGGTTDIAVLSLNGIVSSSSVKIAGNAIDNDIWNGEILREDDVTVHVGDGGE